MIAMQLLGMKLPRQHQRQDELARTMFMAYMIFGIQLVTI